MKLVKVEELEIGDEIMLAQGSKFLFVKVLRTPKHKYRKGADGIKYLVTDYQTHTIPMCSAVLCAVKTVEKSKPGYNGVLIKWKEYDNSLPDYNDQKYFDFNSRDILLIQKL